MHILLQIANKMSEMSILDLNDDCLYAIFEQIKLNCELNGRLTEDTIRYTDLIQFVICSYRFTAAFLDWNVNLFRRLEIASTFHTNCTSAYISFPLYYKRVKKSTETEKEAFWKLFANALKHNTKLECIDLEYNSESYFRDHLEVFEMTMRALQHKITLRKLVIKMNLYSLDNLLGFSHLEILELGVKMDARTLVECVRQNPNLRELAFMSTEIFGRLADIVPYCNNLKILRFRMKSGVDAIEYASLGTLENLESLQIYGQPQVGSLAPLFNSLATKMSKGLEQLSIHEAKINCDEINELATVRSLQNLYCQFIEPQYLELLTSRTQLVRPELYLNIRNIVNKSESDEAPDYIELSLSVDKKSKKLDLFIDNHACSSVLYAFVSKLHNLRKICIDGHQASGALRNLFQGLASRENQTLQKLDLGHYDFDIDCKQIANIAKISSLRFLRFQFSPHADNIDYLVQLKELRTLEIRSEIHIPSDIYNFLHSPEADHPAKRHINDLSLVNSQKDLLNDAYKQAITLIGHFVYLKQMLSRSKFEFENNRILIFGDHVTYRFDVKN